MTVISMPTFKCRPWLENAIQSVLSQTAQALDLYVVDDTSGDIDSDLVRSYPEVTFARTRARQGPYGIANLVVAWTQSAFVAFHDADDISAPDRFHAQQERLVSGHFDGCGTWMRMLDLHGDFVGLHAGPGNATAALRNERSDVIAHPTSMYRRSVFSRLGGFDSSTRIGADTEWLYRTGLGFQLGNVERLLYTRAVRPSSLTLDPATAIGSMDREAYFAPIREAAEVAYRAGTPAPPPWTTIDGRAIPTPDPAELEWLHVADGNTTLIDAPVLPTGAPDGDQPAVARTAFSEGPGGNHTRERHPAHRGM